MNNSNLKEIVENLIDTFIHAGKISLNLRKQGLIKKSLAINEVSILRQSRQAASVFIKVGSKIIIKRLRFWRWVIR